MLCPRLKNVAWMPYWSRMSRYFSVYPSAGPSSKVSATSFLLLSDGVIWWTVTTAFWVSVSVSPRAVSPETLPVRISYVPAFGHCEMYEMLPMASPLISSLGASCSTETS